LCAYKRGVACDTVIHVCMCVSVVMYVYV